MTSLRTEGFTLHPWQSDALEAWTRGEDGGSFRGTLEIVTGGGKTLIALACAERAALEEPELKLAVVVPTEALAHQWREVLLRYTNLSRAEIGLLGAGHKDAPESFRALVAVLNTAADRLPELAQLAQPLMLVVDECHRAGAPSFSRVLNTRARYRLGLSATPKREELDETGEPLTFDEQLVGKSLGSVVYRFTLRDAQEAGWLPDYDIHHHGLSLTEKERIDYEAATRRVDEAVSDLRASGVDAGRAQQIQSRTDEVGRLARSFIAATSQRKDLLYRADERHRITERIVRSSLDRGKQRILLFHERMVEAEALAAQLSSAGIPHVGLEHSRLPTKQRSEVLDGFRRGGVKVLVSVKSLVEGIDVPEADVGISVASTSSVRQRVQSLGRVLRRQFDQSAERKHAEMHLFYMADTVDESIYSKEDWADLTGIAANHYWTWALEGESSPVEGPPATPLPTEHQEWERLGGRAPSVPEPWLGVVHGAEYSVDTLGTVTNMLGKTISNPQGVDKMVSSVRNRPGGRFRVTPRYRFVLVWSDRDDVSGPFVAGRLLEPFSIAPQARDQAPDAIDVAELTPGDLYPGADSRGGTFKLSQKKGGVIERRTKTGSEFALVADTSHPSLEENAKRVLEAWHALFDRGITFHVTEDGHAWFMQGGQRRFLAAVPGGFIWPSMMEGARH